MKRKTKQRKKHGKPKNIIRLLFCNNYGVGHKGEANAGRQRQIKQNNKCKTKQKQKHNFV